MKVGTDGVLLGAWTPVAGADSILDVGAGTGVIALMLAQRSPMARITGIELDGPASIQARENVSASPWNKRVEILNIGLQVFKPGIEYDLIVSNPPFFEEGTPGSGTSRQQARQMTTLDHAELIRYSEQLLSRPGKLSMILPITAVKDVADEAKNVGLFLNHLVKVRSKHDKPVHRGLMLFSRSKESLIENELVIQYEQRNDYTEAYKKLTRAFYTIM